jgi:hypothetical protein
VPVSIVFDLILVLIMLKATVVFARTMVLTWTIMLNMSTIHTGASQITKPTASLDTTVAIEGRSISDISDELFHTRSDSRVASGSKGNEKGGGEEEEST